MAWKDLSIAQRSQLMNLYRRNGITDLSQMRQNYDLFSLPSLEETNRFGNPVAPVYADGGNKFSGIETPSQRKNYNGQAVTLEAYKEMQRQAIRDAAVKKALARTAGVAPIINGKPDSSCIYTFTDNYGRKYQVAGTQAFAANPEKYGFEVAGPVTKGMEGNMYLMIDENGKPYHANMITGYSAEGNPLVTYSQGHAGVNPPEKDYHKNKPLWYHPGYETYRFVGTPDDNARWSQEWENLQGYPQISPIDTLSSGVKTFGPGGDKEPYFGEITQRRKWNAFDTWMSKNPQFGHGLRKAGVLLNDAMRLIPGVTIKDTVISPRDMTDFGDITDSRKDSAVDKVNSYLVAPLAAATRAPGAQAMVKTLGDVYENSKWATRASNFMDNVGLTDRLINAAQFIDDFATPVDQFSSGGHKIHIKKKNRGKFTALKKRTGHSTAWFKEHGTPAQKKMAVFAQNVKKWKHDFGGIKF